MSDSRLSSRAVVAVFVSAGLIALGARLRLDLGEIDHTLQTLSVVLVAQRLGSGFGALAVCIYLAAGGVGAPVFAGGRGGVDVLLSSTGGYLWGFVLAALLAGLAARTRSFGGLLWWFAVAHAAILTAGAVQMAIHANLSPSGAYRLAIEPYLLGAAVKSLAAAWLARALSGGHG